MGVYSHTLYDGVNRLKSAQEPGGWSQFHVYDAWGNRALVAGTGYYVLGGRPN